MSRNGALRKISKLPFSRVLRRPTLVTMAVLVIRSAHMTKSVVGTRLALWLSAPPTHHSATQPWRGWTGSGACSVAHQPYLLL